MRTGKWLAAAVMIAFPATTGADVGFSVSRGVSIPVTGRVAFADNPVYPDSNPSSLILSSGTFDWQGSESGPNWRGEVYGGDGRFQVGLAGEVFTREGSRFSLIEHRASERLLARRATTITVMVRAYGPSMPSYLEIGIGATHILETIQNANDIRHTYLALQGTLGLQKPAVGRMVIPPSAMG